MVQKLIDKARAWVSFFKLVRYMVNHGFDVLHVSDDCAVCCFYNDTMDLVE